MLERAVPYPDPQNPKPKELSGPLRVVLERRDGSDGRVAVEYSTYGTNDDDPDFTPVVSEPYPPNREANQHKGCRVQGAGVRP